jgi:deoxyribose-phosphate aldolase
MGNAMSSASSALDWKSVAAVIDHTLLKPEATAAQVEKLCAEAAQYGFACAMVNTAHAARCVAALRGTPIKTGVTLAFPLGATLTSVKRFEAAEAVRLGVDELDMVLNVGALKAGERTLVEDDIRGVVEIGHAAGAIVKVILETCLLTSDEKQLACELALAAGADFVKTSTGFGGGGATVEDVALLRRVVGNRAGVKASGGIRTAADVAAMLKAGADRIGASAGVAIVKELGAS